MHAVQMSKVSFDRVRIGKIHCDPVDYVEARDAVHALVETRSPHLVLTPNLTQVRQANKIPVVAEAYRSASLSTPDGWPIAAVLRMLGKRHQGRVTGSDLTPLMCMEEFRIGLVGGRGDSAVRAARRLQARNPGLDVGLVEAAEPEEMADPGQRAALLDRIAAADLDLIFLGVGVPKQEKLALELLSVLDRGVVLCVGATIDFLAGEVRRSPKWVQRLGLEWAYRIAMEPRRMFSRYALALPVFLWESLRALRAGAERPVELRA